MAFSSIRFVSWQLFENGEFLDMNIMKNHLLCRNNLPFLFYNSEISCICMYVIMYVGPIWLPLLGCFLTFRYLRWKHQYNYLVSQELARVYGPILGLKLGNQKVVVISTNDLVRKILLQDEFNGRPDGFFFRVRSFGKRKGVYT